MARVRMVTRTIEVSVCEVMCVNISTAEVSVNTYELSGKLDNTSILKVLSTQLDENIKAVAVQSVEIKEVLYGMSEIDFIKLAKVLPPRTSSEPEIDYEPEPKPEKASKRSKKN